MPIKIIPYQKEYTKAFKDFNIEWLEKYFYVEPYDLEVLSQPEKYIINPGGHIFFAIENNAVVGVVALLKHQKGVFELTKMAVPPIYQGKNIGQQLMQYCIDFARETTMTKLILYSHTKLKNAIYIYRKYGFIEIGLEPDTPYDRSDIKMELLISD